MEQVGHYSTAPHYAFLFLPLYRRNAYEYLTKIHCLNIIIANSDTKGTFVTHVYNHEMSDKMRNEEVSL